MTVDKSGIEKICCSLMQDLETRSHDGGIKIIGIDGPTAAGKTILSDYLADLCASKYQKKCFIYRLDWTLIDRNDRLNDLKSMVGLGKQFNLEAELHMRLPKLAIFLQEVAVFNGKNSGTKNQNNVFKTTLSELYSRENGGTLSGACRVELPPGSLVIVEGHYSLRSELDKYFDLNVLLLSDKRVLLDRKIARVSSYRDGKEAEVYFHFIDVPSFDRHLQRFGQNATHIIQNNDFNNPQIVSADAIREWRKQDLDNGHLYHSGLDLKNDQNISEIFDSFFSLSIHRPNDFIAICKQIAITLGELNEKILHLMTTSPEEQAKDLSEVVANYLINIPGTKLGFENSLRNVYFRVFPISICISLVERPDCNILIDFYEDKIQMRILWSGGATTLISKNSLSDHQVGKNLSWKVENVIPQFQSNENTKITLASPTSFIIPPIFDGEGFFHRINGKESENISPHECLFELNNGNFCWVNRFTLFEELQLFDRLCSIIGAQSILIGSYLIAIKTSNQIIQRRFKKLRKYWSAYDYDTLKIDDAKSYDSLIIKEREELKEIVNKTSFFKALDTHLFLKKTHATDEDVDKLLANLKSFLSSKNRLLRKRAFQYIVRNFGNFELSVKKIWKDFECSDHSISIQKLCEMQPSIMGEIYLWMSIRSLRSAILGANIYDISKNSLDALGHLKAAALENSPVILQSSLNALGPETSTEIFGYLRPRQGAKDLIRAAFNAIRSIYINTNLPLPFYGIGLDHIDSKNDVPHGRARKFLEDSVSTGLITHIVLDGSHRFYAKDQSVEILAEAYNVVAQYAANLLLGLNDAYLIDKEICMGELNYIGNSKLANIPDPYEITLFVESFKSHLRNKNLKSFLRRPMLFVANVGTTHHSVDTERINPEITGEWVANVSKDLFVSAVLHGTTGTKAEVLQSALSGCKKINIAGDFLKTYIDSLPPILKNKLLDRSFGEPKKALSIFREEILGLPQFDRDSISESICVHTRSIIETLNSPKITEEDKKYFRYVPFIFDEEEIEGILEEVRMKLMKTSSLDFKCKPSTQSKFSASLIEVAYGVDYYEKVKLLTENQVTNFHVDVGDGIFISRKISGIMKVKKLKELNENLLISAHLMVRDPHLMGETKSTKSYIRAYANAGCSRIAVHTRSVANIDQFIECLEQIRSCGSEPGIVIEVNQDFDKDIMSCIVNNHIKWLVVMGVHIGYGGQIFNVEVLHKIEKIRSFSELNKLGIQIEVDGGLTLSNIGACRLAGAEIFAGWSIIKPDVNMSMVEKLSLVNKLI